MSRDGDSVKGILYLLLGGGYFLWRGFKNLKLHRKISGLATSKARSMAMGLVELSGVARPAFPRQDPVYSKPCCYFRLKLEQYRSSGKSGHWVTIHEDSSDGSPFYCQDITGKVVIVPKNPEIHFTNRFVFKNGIFGTKDSSAVAFFNSRWKGLSSLRLTMNVLREGDPLYVNGCALPRHIRISSENAPDQPISMSEAARELKKDPEAMKSLDVNKDGHIDAQEFEIGLKKFKEFLVEKKKQPLNKQNSEAPLEFEGIVTKTDEHELIFANSEADLLSRLGPIVYLQILGGAAALVGGLILLCLKIQGR